MIHIQYVAWLMVSHPEEDSKHFLSLTEYFPDAVTSDKLTVLDLCLPTSYESNQCVDMHHQHSLCINSTLKNSLKYPKHNFNT